MSTRMCVCMCVYVAEERKRLMDNLRSRLWKPFSKSAERERERATNPPRKGGRRSMSCSLHLNPPSYTLAYLRMQRLYVYTYYVYCNSVGSSTYVPVVVRGNSPLGSGRMQVGRRMREVTRALYTLSQRSLAQTS